MANPPKQQGTKRETALVNHATDVLQLAAQRAPNNSPGWDVDLEVGDSTVRVEVKDRQRLNVHDTINEAVAANDGHETMLFWHRYVKKKGNQRRTSLGSVWVVPEDVMDRIFVALEHHCPDWAEVRP